MKVTQAITAVGLVATVASAAPAPVDKRTTLNVPAKTKYNLEANYLHDAAKHGRRDDTLLAGAMALKQQRYIGQATEVYTLAMDAKYAGIAASYNFDRVTPENSMKWESIEPKQNMFDYGNGDALVAWAHANHQAVRGHNLVWHSQLPTWVTAPATPWNYTGLKAVLENHVRTVVSHYKGMVDMWDVVNEPFNDDGTFRQSLWYTMFGTDYIKWALTWAHEEDPDALLFINDYNFEYIGPKVNNATAFFKELVDEGYPLGAVGVEAHMVVGQVNQAAQTATFEQFTSFGLKLYLTELDIRFDLGRYNNISNYTASQVGQQNSDYYAVTNACLAVDACLGISIWEFSDKFSWIPGVFTGQGAADIYDVNNNPKGSKQAMLDAINEVPCSVCKTSGLNA